jgi:multidrug efflux pump subunit AcrB
MVGFLIRRPIAVSMALLGFLVLGVVAAGYLPVSLVPDVDIPRISVNVNAPGYAARELDNSLMSVLRMQLMQVNNLREIRSETRDGVGTVSLEFEYGTNVDLAYIEVNEQVDKTSGALPAGIRRPSVIKASASDIPVLYLDISLKEKEEGLSGEMHQQHDFLALSGFVDEVIRRRLEQIPQVAMADMSGRAFSEIIITPQTELFHAMGLPIETIGSVIQANNLSLGNITLRDKQFQYTVRVGNQIVDADDIGNLYLKHHGRLWQIKDLCTIETRPRQLDGMVISQGRRAISLAIIKQADARMQDMKLQLNEMVDHFRSEFPDLHFSVSRDQTALLDYTLENLRQTLLVGAVLAFLVMFFFLRDGRSPWLIIISVPAALIVSLLLFYMAGISVNIISLSGLILCVGMMIDNSIIVIDNIARYREGGMPLSEACIKGTNEVFRPLLSSVLTTCSVFIPLIFLSGLTGALFFDQAMAVTIGLMVSLMVAMTIVPVYYHLLYKGAEKKGLPVQKRRAPFDYKSLYTRGFHFVMRHQVLVWLLFAAFAGSLLFLFPYIEKQRMPEIKRQAVILWVDWNEHIHVEENQSRLHHLMNMPGLVLEHHNIQLGRQQFLLDHRQQNNQQQAQVYMLASDPEGLLQAKEHVEVFFREHYPDAIWQFREEDNLFDMLFASREAPLEVRLRPLRPHSHREIQDLQQTRHQIREKLPGLPFDPLPLQQIISLYADQQLLSLYDVDAGVLQQALRRALNEDQVFTLMDSRSSIPVKVSGRQSVLEEVLQTDKVRNRQGAFIPLGLLLRQSLDQDLQYVVAGLEGVYYPIELNVTARQLAAVQDSIRTTLRQEGLFEASFTGSLFSQRELMFELLVIGVVALLLLFFILAAQFESLRLPFIILLEIPLAMSGALLLLMLFGVSLNIMSMIGMVVMAGIIINDSILKVDTINRLRNNGMSLLRAIYTAGHYRLKPILMTSITTIFALLPFLFTSGMGSDLQRPLAIAVIGGLGLGTFVSLFFIPVCYYYLYSRKK